MGLVEKQGVGVDRMYREMVTLGHRPPSIAQGAGPIVKTRLVGGEPLAAVMALMSAIVAPERQADVRVALVVHALRRDGLATADSVGGILQVPRSEADEALDVAARCTIAGEPLIHAGPGAIWLPASELVARSTPNEGDIAAAKRRGLLTWWRPDDAGALRLVQTWLRTNDKITSGDLASITSYHLNNARQVLTRLEEQGHVVRGAAMGRNAHFRLPS